MNKKELVEYALMRTRILRMPRQSLSTFGTTNIEYYLLSGIDEMTRVREGRVVSSRPRILKPDDIAGLFDGFGESGGEYGGEIFEVFGKNPRILDYRFKNEPRSSSETAAPISEVYERIRKKIESKGNAMAAIVEGVDSTWQISLMKFIVDMTLKSAGENISEMEEKGMFPDEKGVPESVRNRIEFLFREAASDRAAVKKLGSFLTGQGLFREYEDRFFRLLGK